MDWQTVAVIAIVALLIVGVRFTGMMRQMTRTAGPPPRTKTDEARTILENRYALGEIDAEEFAQRMQVLNEERERTFQRARGRPSTG